MLEGKPENEFFCDRTNPAQMIAWAVRNNRQYLYGESSFKTSDTDYRNSEDVTRRFRISMDTTDNHALCFKRFDSGLERSDYKASMAFTTEKQAMVGKVPIQGLKFWDPSALTHPLLGTPSTCINKALMTSTQEINHGAEIRYHRKGHSAFAELKEGSYFTEDNVDYYPNTWSNFEQGHFINSPTELTNEPSADILQNAILLQGAIPHGYRKNNNNTNSTFFDNWYASHSAAERHEFGVNGQISITEWAKSQKCPLYAGCILRSFAGLSARNKKDINDNVNKAELYVANNAQMRCVPFWYTSDSGQEDIGVLHAEDPGMAMTPSSDGDLTLNSKWMAGTGQWIQIQDTNKFLKSTKDIGGTFKDKIILKPFTILPPEIGATKYIPQFETPMTTQLLQDFGNPESLACECGGGEGIRFFHVTTELRDLDSPSAFQNATNKFKLHMKAFLSDKPHLRDNFGYRVYAYSWVHLIGSAPLVGIPIVSHKVDHVVYERNIFRNPAITDTHRAGLTGQSAGFPNWGSKTLRHKYWVEEPMQGSHGGKGNKFPYPRVPTDLENIDASQAALKISLSSDKCTGAPCVNNVNVNDIVCPLSVLDSNNNSRVMLYHKPEKSYVYVDGTGSCSCQTYACSNATNCTITINVDMTEAQTTLTANYTYDFQLGENEDDYEIHCFNVWEHQYRYQSSCLRYPWGMVQSWELPSETRARIFPPPVTLEHQTYNYCENLSPDTPESPVFLDCANDHLGYDARKKFCDESINPLVTHTIEALVMTRRGLMDMCSKILKVCLFVPGTPEYGKLGSLLDQNELDLTNYTILVAPFTGDVLGHARAFSIDYTPDHTHFNNTETLQHSAAQTNFFGFAINAETFAILAHTEYAASIDKVINAVETLTHNLETLQAASNGACESDAFVRVVADSDSSLAYKCVEAFWWRADPIPDINMKIRNSNITIKAAVERYGLEFKPPFAARYGNGCTRFQVGAPMFKIEATFDEYDTCPTDATGSPLVFAGASAAGAHVNITTNRVGGTAVMFLGYDSEFFGSHPTISVENDACN